MQVILLENIKNLGKIGDIVKVKRGYARNYLIKFEKALNASKENIKIVNNKKGNYIHFKIKGNGSTVSELEKNEKIDNELLRFLTVKVKKFDLDKNYFKQDTRPTKEFKKKWERTTNQ